MKRPDFSGSAAVLVLLVLCLGSHPAPKAIVHQTILRGENVELPGALVSGDKAIWVVLSTRSDGRSKGYISAHEITSGKHYTLTAHDASYGPPAAVAEGDGLCVVAARWEGNSSHIILANLTADGNITRRTLSGPGFHENPTICRHAGEVFVAWATCNEGTSAVSVVNATPEEPVGISVPSQPGPCYRPKLASDGNSLFLIFEHFTNGRYRLECCLTQDARAGFGQTSQMGFPDGNDMSPTVISRDGDLLVTWENSIPLQKGWTHPAGKGIITIPGFGHGWRVETKMGLRRLRSSPGGGIEIQDLAADGSPELNLGATTSAGCPRVLPIGNDGLAVVYLTIDRKHWALAGVQLVNGVWQELDLPPILQDRRVPPTVMAAPGGDRLLSLGFPDTTKSELHIAVTNVRPATQSPTFVRADDGYMRATEIRRPLYAPSRKIVENGLSLQLFWGDLHMHTNISRCSLNTFSHCSEPEEKYRFARDVGALDFAMITDHAEHTDQAQWQRIVEAADRNYHPGHFVSFIGFEWTSSSSRDRHGYGHYNVLFRERGTPYSSEAEGSRTPTELWGKLEKGKALTIPHHPAHPGFVVNWDFYNPDFVRLVEIFQVRGSYEYDNCPMTPSSYGRGRIVPEGCVRNALEYGHRLGFTSGGEHEGVGVTAVFAEDLSREAIFDSLFKRHTYGTTGDRIFIEFRVNNSLMGSEIQAGKAPPVIDFEVIGTASISSITLVRSGLDIKRWTPNTEKLKMHWTDQETADSDEEKGSYYYLVIQQQNGEMAWTSPVFLMPSKHREDKNPCPDPT